MNKKVTTNQLEHKSKVKEYIFAVRLAESAIKTKEMLKKQSASKNPQISRIDVLLLIAGLKEEFEKINQKSEEIAQSYGRTAVTYADAEEAIRLIRAENKGKIEKKLV